VQKRFSTSCETVCASPKRRSSPTQVPRQVTLAPLGASSRSSGGPARLQGQQDDQVLAIHRQTAAAVRALRARPDSRPRLTGARPACPRRPARAAAGTTSPGECATARWRSHRYQRPSRRRTQGGRSAASPRRHWTARRERSSRSTVLLYRSAGPPRPADRRAAASRRPSLPSGPGRRSSTAPQRWPRPDPSGCRVHPAGRARRPARNPPSAGRRGQLTGPGEGHRGEVDSSADPGTQPGPRQAVLSPGCADTSQESPCSLGAWQMGASSARSWPEPLQPSGSTKMPRSSPSWTSTQPPSVTSW
jgi:hypothetical protein